MLQKFCRSENEEKWGQNNTVENWKTVANTVEIDKILYSSFFSGDLTVPIQQNLTGLEYTFSTVAANCRAGILLSTLSH